MNTWDDWSDLDLTKSVADLVFGKGAWIVVNSWSDGDFVAKLVNHKQEKFCINNPEDMWPLIVENKIETCWFCGDKWRAVIDNQFQTGEYKKFVHLNEKPLRAAAIVFLEMNGVKP